jgi:hypothetical protein
MWRVGSSTLIGWIKNLPFDEIKHHPINLGSLRLH